VTKMKPRRSLDIVILLIVLPQLILIGELICMKLAQGFDKSTNEVVACNSTDFAFAFR